MAKCLFWRNINKVFFWIHFQVGQDRQMYLRFFSCYFSWCWLKATLFRAIRFVSLWRLAKVRMTLACSCLMGHVCLVFKIIWKKKFNAKIFFWVLCWGNVIPPAVCRSFDHFEMKFNRNNVVSKSIWFAFSTTFSTSLCALGRELASHALTRLAHKTYYTYILRIKCCWENNYV